MIKKFWRIRIGIRINPQKKHTKIISIGRLQFGVQLAPKKLKQLPQPKRPHIQYGCVHGKCTQCLRECKHNTNSNLGIAEQLDQIIIPA
jgi:hypothetical protein